MRRMAGGFLAAVLAFCLLLSSAPQEGRKSEEHSMLQTQLHTLALEENAQGRWQCEVRLRGQKPTVWPGLQNVCSLPHGKIVTAGCWSVSCAADFKMRKGLSNGQAFSSGNQMVKRRSLQREPASTATKIS